MPIGILERARYGRRSLWAKAQTRDICLVNVKRSGAVQNHSDRKAPGPGSIATEASLWPQT